MTVLRADTFTRANVGGSWGTASDGNAWTTQTGAATLNLTSNEGVIESSSASMWRSLGAALTVADAECLVRFTPGTISGSVDDAGGAVLRMTAAATSYYMGRFGYNSGASRVEFQLFARYSSANHVLASGAAALSAGTAYWIRFRVQGSNLYGKWWQDGTSEPVPWTLTATDANVTAAGFTGLYGYGNGSPGGKFDSFTASDLVTANALVGTAAGVGVATGNLTVGAPANHLVGVAAGVGTATGTPTNTPPAGLVVSTQTQNGISGGPPGNGTTETDVTWLDAAGDGWRVGIIPAYGGALASPWYVMTAGAQSIPQTSLATTQPDGLVHMETQISGSYKASEQFVFTSLWSELAPVGQPFRRYYDSGTSPTDANGFRWRVRTCFQPGNPGFLFHRIDLTNPSGSGIALTAGDSVDDDMLAGLTQVSQGGATAWTPANGGHGSVAGGSVAGWGATTYTAGDPDFVWINASTASALGAGIIGIRKTSLASIAGASGLQYAYAQDAVRMKFNAEISSAVTIPAATTYSFYFLQALRPGGTTGAEVVGIAADYLNPESSAVVSHGTPASPFFSYDEGTYEIAAASNAAQLTFALPAPATVKWLPSFKLTGYTLGTKPAVVLGGTALVEGTDYLAHVDTGAQIAYVKLLKQVVAAGAGAGQLNNGLLAVGTVTDALVGSAAGIGVVTGALALTKPLTGTVAGVAMASGAISLAKHLLGTIAGTGVVTGSVALAKNLAGTVAGVGVATGAVSVAKALVGLAKGIGTATGAASVTKNLAGIAAGVGTLTGDLTTAASVALRGLAAGVGSAVGGLSLTKGLAGMAAGRATVTGAASVAKHLGGVAAGVGTTVGDLSMAGVVALRGLLAGAGAALGTLSLQKHLGAVAAGRGAASGAARIAKNLAGTAAGVGVSVAAISIGKLLSGLAAGIGRIVGTLGAAVTSGSVTLADFAPTATLASVAPSAALADLAPSVTLTDYS